MVFGALRCNRMLPPWNRGDKFASRLGFTTANIFTDGVNVIVKPLRVCGAVAMDFKTEMYNSSAASTTVECASFLSLLKSTTIFFAAS